MNLTIGIKDRQEEYVETSIPRILHTRDTHAALIEGIRSGSIFGFGVCSVRSPDSLVAKATNPSQRFLFPPICRSLPLEPGHLSKLTERRWRESKCPPLSTRTIVQTYHTEGQLILSETIAFYLQMGMSVQIEEFFQFQAAKSFTPFTHKVISLRKRSKMQGNTSMGTTAKLIGNSAYGKTLGKKN